MQFLKTMILLSLNAYDDLIMLMYTSGTTGHPERYDYSQDAVFNIVNLASTARITDKAVQLVSLPLFHTEE